jgi:hypothetical protein
VLRQRTALKQTLGLVLTACLVLVLLALGFLSANGPWHKAWQHHDTSDGGGCAICLFAKGQVDVTGVLTVLGPAVFVFLRGLLFQGASAPWGIDLLLPPGRAPPCPASIS